jgi:glycosyltransferase involved in cell wall biosynthesis
MNQVDGVSIIVCCYNSAGRIVPTLEHLQKIQSAGISWEVIVVDNNSGDNTSSITAEIWKKNPVVPIRIVEEKQPGLMHARIKGVAVSSYEILSFIDDDNWVDANWIENIYRIFTNDHSIAACGGESIPEFESSPPQWFTNFQSSFAVGKQQEQTGYVDVKKGYLWGAGLSIRKSAWNQLFDSGFKSRLSGRKGTALTAGEDSEICLAFIRRGWKLWYDNSLKLRHYIPSPRMSEDYVKRMYVGFGRAEMILSVYRNLISNQREKHSWWLQLLTAIKQLVRSGLKSIFSPAKNRFVNNILWIHDKAYVSELLSNRSAFYQTLDSVKSEKVNQTRPA